MGGLSIEVAGMMRWWQEAALALFVFVAVVGAGVFVGGLVELFKLLLGG